MGPGDVAFAVLGLVIGYLIGDLIKLMKKPIKEHRRSGYGVLSGFPVESTNYDTPDRDQRGLLTPRKEK